MKALLIYCTLDNKLIDESGLYQMAMNFNPEFAETLTYEVIIPLEVSENVRSDHRYPAHNHEERTNAI